MANNETIPEREETLVSQAEADVSLLHQMVHGGENTEIITGGGPVPSLLKWQKDASSFFEDAANRAEVARDAAVLSAGIVATTAAGLAATANGGYFSVPSENGNEYLIVYRNDAGVATEIKRYPSAVFIDYLISKISSLLPDNGIKLDATYDEHGVYRLSVTNAQGEMLIGIGEKIVKWMGHRVELNANGRLNFMDDKGVVALSLDPRGRAYAADMTIGSLRVLDPDFKAAAATVATPLPFGRHKQTDLMHVSSDGQSLCSGVNSRPAISTTQPYSNLTFASGVVVRPKDGGYNPAALKPLIEEELTVGDGTLGETPVSGACNGLSRRLAMRGEDTTKWVFLGHRVGQSGQSVEAASPGGSSATFEGLIKTVDDAHAYAVANGKTYSFWAHIWIQGETNIVSTVVTNDALEYANKVLRQDQALADHIAAKGYQDFRHLLVTYQTGAHRKYDLDNLKVASGQWGISRQHAHVCLASPVYIMPTATDNLHLTNEGSWLLGQYISRAIYSSCAVHGKKWRPLEPEQVTWTSSHVDIKFHVPQGVLVLDNALCATVATGYFGFDIREAGVVATDLISSVVVTGADTVRLNLSRAPAGDALLSYARGRPGDPTVASPINGPRGNLRDTHGEVDQVVSPLGNTFALHNSCVMFEHHRVNGFS